MIFGMVCRVRAWLRSVFPLLSTTFATFSAAGAAAGTTDTLDAAFLCLIQMPAGQGENDCDHRKNDEIFHGVTSFHAAKTPQPDSGPNSGSEQPRCRPGS